MKLIDNLSNFTRGWIIGDFLPSVIKTTQFEVGYQRYAKGEISPAHFHEKIREINLLTKGSVRFGDTIFHKDDIFIFEPGDIADPEFLEDCEIVCVKIPSIPTDKIYVQ